jgi:hypothetical protein
MPVAIAVERDRVPRADKLPLDIAAFHLRQLVLVFPDQIAVGRVERVHDIVGLRQVHDSVMHERRRFLIARFLGDRSRKLQLSDIVLVDLIERAVAPALVGTCATSANRWDWG